MNAIMIRYCSDLDENSIKERNNPLGNGGNDRHDEIWRVRISAKKSRPLNLNQA